MNFMCYYTRKDVMIFTIVFKATGTELSGSDFTHNLHKIAEHYDVKMIERID